MSTDLKPGMLIRFRPYTGKPCYDIDAQIGMVLECTPEWYLVLIGENKKVLWLDTMIYEVIS